MRGATLGKRLVAIKRIGNGEFFPFPDGLGNCIKLQRLRKTFKPTERDHSPIAIDGWRPKGISVN